MSTYKTEEELLKQFAAMDFPDAEAAFKNSYEQARRLEDAEKKNDARKLAELDFAIVPACYRCLKPCIDPVRRKWKSVGCSNCQALLYCGQACQAADWKKAITPGAHPHKYYCQRNKEHMKRIPHFQSVFKQFPWARIASDGTFAHDILRARLGVLGSGVSFGYWSQPGGNQPHDNFGELFDAWTARTKLLPRAKGYLHGEVLLGKEWPTDVEAWKLTDEKLIPRLFFTEECQPPKTVKRGEVNDWMSWYAWRGLSLESPATELMDYPLSVYHLLTDVLNIADPNANAKKRQKLLVHFIGTEIELNFLPLFSEVALLLPYTDITLVFFGKAVSDLVRKARQDYPGSLATEDVVWSYTAPKKTGSGSIDIRLHSKTELWDTTATLLKPDVLVGLNAGLLSYDTMSEPILACVGMGIPFAVTEYCEQSLELCVTHIPEMLAGIAKEEGYDKYAAVLTKPRPMPISVNPFHRPGQRQLGVTRLPNHHNGFAMPVVVKQA